MVVQAVFVNSPASFRVISFHVKASAGCCSLLFRRRASILRAYPISREGGSPEKGKHSGITSYARDAGHSGHTVVVRGEGGLLWKRGFRLGTGYSHMQRYALYVHVAMVL